MIPATGRRSGARSATGTPRPGGPLTPSWARGGPDAGPGGGEGGAARRRTGSAPVLAPGDPGGTRLAFPLDRPAALVGRLVQGAPAPAAASPDQLGRGRPRPAPLHPELTNYR